MTTPTASEVNRRIAEFCGWLEVAADMHSLTDPPIPIYKGYPPGSNLERWRENTNRHHIPNYMHDANAAIAAVEKVCVERCLQLTVDLVLLNDRRFAYNIAIWQPPEESMRVRGFGTSKCFAEAAALALFAVLGGDDVQQTKGTR